ncbi:unnamed protein product [Mytilus edulis]|uniref:Uncharacterized protein n=1 Tax=Mytilus edulis TaxID=6550 RepID=A0A8S3V0A8_MYTED|nr:unnamed protein product [Mytilus edulis]
MPIARDRLLPPVEPADRRRSRRLLGLGVPKKYRESEQTTRASCNGGTNRQDAEQQILDQQPVPIEQQRVKKKGCEISCTERWNNLHRRNPLDFKRWKKILCPFVVENNCTYPLRITLIDISDNFVPYKQNDLWTSNSMYGSYFFMLILSNVHLNIKKYERENKEIEYFLHDPSTHAVQWNQKLRNISSPYLSMFKKDSKYRSETVRKQSTIFSIRHFLEDQEILIRPLVFQLFGANKSDTFPPMVFSELLTFVTAIDFKTGCYEFSNISPLQENLSIEQTFSGQRLMSVMTV